MKKKIVSLCLVVCLLATAIIGGTLAYFTDEDTTQNTFTVGNVKLDLFEHEIDEKTNESTVVKTEAITYEDAIVPGHVFLKDPTIKLLQKGDTITSTTDSMLDKPTPYDSEDAYVFLDMTMNKYKSLFPVMAKDAVAATAETGYTQDMYDDCLVTNTETNVTSFSSQAFLKQMADPANKTIFQEIVKRWFVGIDNASWQLCDVFYNCDANDVTKYGYYLTFRFAYIGDDSNENGRVDNKPMEAGDSVTFMTAFQMPTTVTQDMIENNDVTNDFGTKDEPFHLNFKAWAIQADTMESLDDAYNKLFKIPLDTLDLTVLSK